MAIIIRHQSTAAQSSDPQVVPLAEWKGEAGVLLGSADNPAVIAGHLGRLRVVAIHFEQFTDGRGYTLARLLRERFGFMGELRAVGEVLRDNLFYLRRCGFDSFVLSDQADRETALESLSTFSEAYQASVERPEPLFRRRAASALRGDHIDWYTGPTLAEALGL